MKAVFSVLVFLACVLSGDLASARLRRPIVPVPLSALYVPSGFDSDDNVQFVGEGYFPNACFSPAPPEIHVDHSQKTITVNARAYVYQGACAQQTRPNVILPFTVEFNVGPLPPGLYQIVQGPMREFLGAVKITHAVRSNGNYFYAPVSEVTIQQLGAITEIWISGVLLGSCVQLASVETRVENNVIVIEPFAYVEPGNNCFRGYFPFAAVLRVRLPHGRYLLHVRAEDGNAINRMIDVTNIH